MKTDINSRRKFLQTSLLGGAGAILLTSAASAATALACRTTPAQTKGPFYPVDKQLDDDTDLTRVAGRNQMARGQVVYIQGTVRGSKCEPLAGVLVEIWQACESGRYNHPNDPNTAPLDPDFQYFGKAVTDQNGNYLFKTIIPGAYPASQDWMRPPHIHYRVVKRGYHELITQMYFAGQALNKSDAILQDLPPEDQAAVIVPFEVADAVKFGPGTLIGTFDLSLREVQRARR